MKSVAITVGIPPAKLSPNARVHWAVKSTLTKAARREAYAQCLVALGARRPPGWLKARVEVVAYFPTHNHRDPDNLIASLKAYFDGIADSGVISNDKALWPERPIISKDARNPRVELVITGEDAK